MEGPEGTKITGKIAREAISTKTRTGRPKADDSHCIIGKRTYNETPVISKLVRGK